MDEDDQFIRRILVNNFSLSDYEADVYISLLRTGKQSMADIAGSSGVPRQRVYDITEKLQDEGLVEVINESPKHAYALPPSDAFQSVQDEINVAMTHMEDMYQTQEDIGTEIAMFKNEATIENYLERIVEIPSVTISLTFPYQLLGKYETIFRQIPDDVHSKCIISNVPREFIEDQTINLESVTTLASQVRGTPKEEPVAICADRETCLLWIGHPAHAGPNTSEGFHITSPEVSFLFDRFITDLLWSQSKPIRLSEHVQELPRTFLRIKDCIEYVSSVRELGTSETLLVEIEGFDTRRKQPISIAGELLDYYQSNSDIRAYLVINAEDHDSNSGNVVSVGGWNSGIEDYEARQITLRDKNIKNNDDKN
ncbi:TrmB family transcriptional regulator [Halococcus salifodinae]|nr:TrmB family transcriptional regulator sugar-binding domain-containing protein [Halococcus salifodinae]